MNLKQQKERQSVLFWALTIKCVELIIPSCAILATKFHLLTCHRILGISLHICCGTLSLFPFFPDFCRFVLSLLYSVRTNFRDLSLPFPLRHIPQQTAFSGAWWRCRVEYACLVTENDGWVLAHAGICSSRSCYGNHPHSRLVTMGTWVDACASALLKHQRTTVGFSI